MSAEPKCFQEATAEAAIRTLAGKGLRRFLVADEVGLGKTLVASQILLRLARRCGGRLTVFYVTSGRTVAGQNKDRLLDFGDDEPIHRRVSAVDRVGLIPSEADRADLQLYAFSPLTSFPASEARPTLGQVRERAFLHQLLLATYPGLGGRLPIDPFRGQAHRSWPGELDLAKTRRLSSRLRSAYRSALTARVGRGVEAKLVKAAEDRHPAAFMTDLRMALAHASLLLAKPDVVIFDEFQCYRDLVLNRHGETDRLRRALIEGTEGEAPAILLLSATPYRLADDHRSGGATAHAEFHELLGFLGGPSLKNRSEELLERYRQLLQAVAAEGGSELPPALVAQTHAVRQEIEDLFAPVMSRTERDDPVVDADRQTTHVPTDLDASDLDCFRSLAEGVGASDGTQRDRFGTRSDALAYWLSVPLPAQALGPGYAFWKNGSFTSAGGATPIRKSNRYATQPGGWGSPKLRGLARIAGADSLSLPWTAPSLPWWRLGARWERCGEAPKALVFSRYRATPLSIAALTSLAVERANLASIGYDRAWNVSRLSGRTNTTFNLFQPSPFLVDAVDPLSQMCETEKDLRKAARRQLAAALRGLGVSTRPRRRADRRRHRPSWKVLAGIEALQRASGAQGDAGSQASADATDAIADRLRVDDPGSAPQIEARETAEPVSAISGREMADLVDMALGSPAVVMTRALSRHFPEWRERASIAQIASLCWGPLRRYLDNPVFWASLPGKDVSPQILGAVVSGNLESVLDEHVWTRKASLRLDKLVEELSEALGLGTGSFTFQAMPPSTAGVPVRCHAALPFAGAQADRTGRAKARGGQIAPEDALAPARSETIRKSFNTPFWPHVLVTTSVGQEGLDFHSWCDRVVHWDLCSSPVDLEQREGRVQRFASLTIRRWIAGNEREAAMAAAAGSGRSPWSELAALAERNHADSSGLSPWWVLPGAHVRRCVFRLPGGRDALRFRRLQERRLLYRLALGQPNPEDFVGSLQRAGSAARLRPFLLNLSAFHRLQREKQE